MSLSFLVAVIFGIAQVHAAERDRRERLTLETLRNFQTREFAELIHYNRITQTPTTREEFEALTSEEQIRFIQFAQEMEHIGILVADRYIDLDLIDKTLGSFVTTSWGKYQPMFLDMREKYDDPYLAEYFQWLAKCIDDRMTNNPRKPFFENPQIKSGTSLHKKG
jgi:hypothetical protein